MITKVYATSMVIFVFAHFALQVYAGYISWHPEKEAKAQFANSVVIITGVVVSVMWALYMIWR